MIFFKQESYDIIGACMEVHRELGCGFLEGVYGDALEREFIIQTIPFEREIPFGIKYKSYQLNKKYIADFICYNKIIVELKAVNELCPKHEAQVINYLKALNLKLGILVNFGEEKLEYKRLIRKDN